MTVTLSNGASIVVDSLWEMMDAVEDALGTDARQYLEHFIEAEPVSMTEEELREQLREKHTEQLETVRDSLTGIRRELESRRTSKATLTEALDAAMGTIDHALRTW